VLCLKEHTEPGSGVFFKAFTDLVYPAFGRDFFLQNGASLVHSVCIFPASFRILRHC